MTLGKKISLSRRKKSRVKKDKVLARTPNRSYKARVTRKPKWVKSVSRRISGEYPKVSRAKERASLGVRVSSRTKPRPIKRPWYDKLKDPAERAHWRSVSAQWAEDQAREAAEREIAADKKRAYKIVKWHQGLTGRGARLLSAVVGRTVYEAAEVRYGGALLKRAAMKVEAIRKDREKVRKAALAKIAGALKKKGFTMQEVERFQMRVRPRPKLRLRHFFQLHRGKFKGQFEEVDAKTGKRIRLIKTRQGLERAKVARLHRKRAVEVAGHLGLTFRQARELVREVEVQAVKDLHALKRTKAFQDLPKRKQAAYTEKRWKAGSVAVLYALADIEGYR